ncbi:hypothetical protein NXS08_01505 [Gleimia sp. 6138-11-ORH1]|uniref:hypothetical protein n=1 Tax=Gleimia sp. 6138-11-ORH1 TaxID=2973937 RepID=UPI0021696896|nr:hypothetical protein [Gleimia sp. 6138-11-ORH1]MCS4484168.1 hypothetical protein [Gleimia sp. 6138-11-ORH1]
MHSKSQPSIWQLTKAGVSITSKFLVIPISIIFIQSIVKGILNYLGINDSEASDLTFSWSLTGFISVLAIHTAHYLMIPRIAILSGATERTNKLSVRLTGLLFIGFYILTWFVIFAAERFSQTQGYNWNVETIITVLAAFFIADQAAYTFSAIYLKSTSNSQLIFLIIIYSLLLAAIVACLVMILVFNKIGYVFDYKTLLFAFPLGFLLLSGLLSLNAPVVRRA